MKVFPFLKFRYICIAMSVVCIVGGFVATVARGGFNYGLDFQAGISQRVVVDPKVKAPIDQVRASLANVGDCQIQVVGAPEKQEYVVKVKETGDSKTFSEETSKKIQAGLQKTFGNENVRILQTEYVGPRFSADLASQAIFLTSFALLLILLYCWFRFKLSYAVAAIAATLHDTLFMIGFIGAFQLEVSTATVAAVLTIIGYSLNDTIVVFDRIRENQTLMRENPFRLIIDSSITQTLSRTIITSLTTLLAIVALYIFGTGDVHLFALNMIVGIVVGTYSSIFIASPIMYGWTRTAEKSRKVREAKKAGIELSDEEEKDEAVEASAAKEAESEEEADGETDEVQEERKETGLGRLSREQRKRKMKK